MKKLLILLLPITIFSQENYYDTTIARLINQKINEYRIEKGLHPFIETDSLKNETNLYVKKYTNKLQVSDIIEHSNIESEGEVIAHASISPSYGSANENYKKLSKKESYNRLHNVDSIATAIVEGYKNSRSHNVGILDRSCIKFTTSVYVYYHYKKGFENWAVFTATQILEWNYDQSIKNNNLDLF